MHRPRAPTRIPGRLLALILLALLPLLVLVWLQALASGETAAILAALLASGAAALLALLAVRAAGRLQAGLLQAQAESRASAQRLTRLGHELRNPVGAISAAAEVLQAAPADSETAAEARSVIARQVRTLSHRINDLLRPGAPPVGAGTVDPRRRSRQVLVVEDDQPALRALCALLERDGHAVSTAGGADGLARLLQMRPEVAIVAVGGPGSAGFDLARDARAAGYAGRLIALGNAGPDLGGMDARAAGFDAQLVPPVDGPQLSASLAD